MSNITTYYGIPGPVPFLDVDVAGDNLLFLDPHAIRISGGPEPYAQMAVTDMDTFFSEVTRCILHGGGDAHERGLDLLQRFQEPWETRLGLARSGFRGHGGADQVGTWIWDTLLGNVEALVRIGALHHVEQLPMFVEGIDRDITSDITTRIVFDPLMQFTAAMLDIYPQFTAGSHHTESVERPVWDRHAMRWTTARGRLPVANGRPLLLVPKGWARRNLLMSARRYYETTVLSYVQFTQAVLTSDGKWLKTPKDVLQRRAELKPVRQANVAKTLHAFDDEQDLIAAFERFVDERVDDTTEDGTAA
ncbi:hypothetical protein [Propionibacterium freudenreichii]|uniref:hypothetical protein n=1 Tax=Propionibacterium freudenreichii TaxID=1744 RepID=UPI00049EA648|nr:hypothetical protein [Propionibacterium freudenreichii]CDP48247.1 Putative uncharacterized protein [Propionibacterium freudenreichii subsp. freudenreichii]